MTARRNPNIPGATATSWSPPAAVFACTGKRSISRPCWPVRNSASKKSTTPFGSSASNLQQAPHCRRKCSTERDGRGNIGPRQIPSTRFPLTRMPERSLPHRYPRRKPVLANRSKCLILLERAKGFEPSTPTLARLCSTPELHPHPRRVWQPPPGRRASAELCQRAPGFATAAPGNPSLGA